MRRRFVMVATTVAVLSSAGLAAERQQTQFVSHAAQVSLVELYSSEGCDSCPPAETWLGTLKAAPDLWTAFVPVGFHVDYWDYLGWRDPLASAAYSERQYRYVQAAGDASAYTPELVLNGQEWRDWRGRKGVPLTTADVGTLAATVAGASLTVTFRPSRDLGAAYVVHVARLGFGIKQSIERGENRGKTLIYDFVAQGYTTQPLVHLAGGYQTTLSLPSPGALPAQRSGIAVWVTKGNDTRPIQATGGYLP